MKKSKKNKAKSSLKDRVKSTVKRKVEQVREPFSLLNTFKEEGMASAIAMLSMAGGMASELKSSAAKNLKADAMKPALRELILSLGFAFREDLEKLEARLEELEDRLTEMESEKLREEE